MKSQDELASDTREALLSALHARIAGFATYLGRRSDAEDIAQETILVLMRRYDHVTDPEEFVKTANRICVNIVRNRRRADHRGTHVELPEKMSATSDYDPEEIYRRRELWGILDAASRGRCKTWLLLRLRGASSQEICDELGVTPNNLYSIKSRCWQRLKGILGG